MLSHINPLLRLEKHKYMPHQCQVYTDARGSAAVGPTNQLVLAEVKENQIWHAHVNSWQCPRESISGQIEDIQHCQITYNSRQSTCIRIQ